MVLYNLNSHSCLLVEFGDFITAGTSRITTGRLMEYKCMSSTNGLSPITIYNRPFVDLVGGSLVPTCALEMIKPACLF